MAPACDPRPEAHRRAPAAMSDVLGVGILAVAVVAIVFIGAVFLVTVIDEDTDLDG